VGIEEALSHTVQGSPAVEDEVVTVLDRSEAETVLDTRLASLAGGKKGCQASEPFLSAARDVVGLQGIGKLLKPLGVAPPQEGVGAREEADLLELLCEPVVRVQVDTSRKARAEAHEHAAPGAVVDI